MSRATQLHSEIHLIMLIDAHFPFISEYFNDTLKCARPNRYLKTIYFYVSHALFEECVGGSCCQCFATCDSIFFCAQTENS